MGLVSVYCPLRMTGAGRLVVQTGERRFVADCKVKPTKLVAQVRTTVLSEGVMVSCGGVGDGKEMLNIVPFPVPAALELCHVVPNRLLSDKTRPPFG